MNRFDGDEGAWRELLRRWPAPQAPERLEQALRGEFQRRRHRGAFKRWGAWAAVAALAVSGALSARWRSGPERTAGEGVPAREPDAVAVDLDLSGFEPMRRLRLSRTHRVVSETSLDGFEPVRRMTLSRWNRGGRP